MKFKSSLQFKTLTLFITFQIFRMTDILCHEVAEISKKFIKLSKSAVKEPNTIDPLVEKIETVRNNAVSYIKQAFDLVIPVLQVGVATQIC